MVSMSLSRLRIEKANLDSQIEQLLKNETSEGFQPSCTDEMQQLDETVKEQQLC